MEQGTTTLHMVLHVEALQELSRLAIQNSGTNNAQLKHIQEGLLG